MEFTDVIDVVVLVFGLLISAMMYFLVKRGILKPHMWGWVLAILAGVVSLLLIIPRIVYSRTGNALDPTSCFPIIGVIITAYITGRILERLMRDS